MIVHYNSCDVHTKTALIAPYITTHIHMKKEIAMFLKVATLYLDEIAMINNSCHVLSSKIGSIGFYKITYTHASRTKTYITTGIQ